MEDLELQHIDIKTTFFNGPLEEEIYLQKPKIPGPGFWKLKKGLYGLKQAGRSWHLEFNAKYTSLGFARCKSDWSVHDRRPAPEKSISETSVDNILLASSSTSESDSVTHGLAKFYEIVDNGSPSWLLGCKIIRIRGRCAIYVYQDSYIDTTLHEFKMETCNTVSTPLQPGTSLTMDLCPSTYKEREAAKQLPYCRLFEKLMYLITATRPDLVSAVRELAKFTSNYGKGHWNVAKHVLRYLQGTCSQALVLGNFHDPYPIFRGFTDSDRANTEGQKSILGYVMMIGTSPIAWSSKQQSIVALSSCEAEYIACSHAACKVIWLRNLLLELGYPQPRVTLLYCDNSGTVDFAHDPHSHTRMKHIDICAHFIQNQVNNGVIDVVQVPGKENVADICTKSLPRILHKNALKMLGVDAGQGGVS